MYLLFKEVKFMEIELFLMENLFFPLLVALIILFIEKYIEYKSENK